MDVVKESMEVIKPIISLLMSWFSIKIMVGQLLADFLDGVFLVLTALVIIKYFTIVKHYAINYLFRIPEAEWTIHSKN